MKLRFDYVELQNFKAFRGRHALDFAEYGTGLHYFRGTNIDEPRLGANGTAKSTLLCDTLVWCLYGVTARRLKSTDVRPWSAKGKGTWVSVGFRCDSEAHEVRRSLTPNLLTLDGKEVGQAKIDRVLGMNVDLFTNTIMLPQGEPLFYDMAPRAKMELFVNALQLDRWDERADAALQRVKHLADLSSRLEGEENATKQMLEQTKDLIATTQKSADSWERDLEWQTKALKKKVASVANELDKAINLQGKADLQLEAAEIEVRHYEREIAKLDKHVLDVDRKRLKAQERYNTLRHLIEGFDQEISSVGRDGLCPTCGQSLKGTSLETHRKRVLVKIERLQNEIDDIPLKKCNRNFDRAMEDAEKARKHFGKFVDAANDARDSLETRTKRVAELKAHHVELRETAKRRSEERNPHLEHLRALKKQQSNILDALDGLKQEIGDLERKAERAKFWIKGFKDVRLYVLEDVLDELELTTNAMLGEAGLIGWRVRYDIEKETKRGTITRGLQIMIKSPKSRGEVKWQSWSGGEGQRLRLVGSLALSEVLLNHAGVKPDIEILDEPTQHLSSVGVDDLCEYLFDRSRRLKKRIFYVDHQSIESTRFDTVTTITRDMQGPRIGQAR